MDVGDPLGGDSLSREAEHSLTKKWLYLGPEILSAGWMDPGLVEGSPVQVKVER